MNLVILLGVNPFFSFKPHFTIPSSLTYLTFTTLHLCTPTGNPPIDTNECYRATPHHGPRFNEHPARGPKSHRRSCKLAKIWGEMVNEEATLTSTFRSQLHISDLSSLSRTCKTLNNAFLAKLYSHVVIRVPIRWSRLVSLENLVSSTGSGLKFITSIRVIAQQQPLNNETQESEDGRTAQEIAEERDLFFCLPSSSASKALNGIIRLLLMRIPDNRLKGFR